MDHRTPIPTLGARLRPRRQAQGLTIQQVADAAGLARAAAHTLFPMAKGATRHERLFTRFPLSPVTARRVHESPRPSRRPALHPGAVLFTTLTGSLAVRPQGAVLLEQGDPIHFDARRPHAARHHASVQTTMLWCGTVDLPGDGSAKTRGAAA